MGYKVDPIRTALVKKARLEGKTKAQALRDAGYKESAIIGNVTRKKTIINADREILAEMKAKDINVDWVVNQLTKELGLPDCKASDRIRVKELLGKYLGMFKDNNITQVAVFNGLTEQDIRDLPNCL